MKADEKVIDHLNQVLANELIAINQYFLHARMYKNWGLARLDAHEYKDSISAMKDADKLIERILLLEGLPNVQKLGKLSVGENAEEMLNCDLTLARQSHATLKNAIACCETAKDFVSRELLENILSGEEEHIDWLETQQELIGKTGLQNYLQSQM